MNTLRTNFILPLSHKIVITPYWFLGFIEGDGSFLVSTLNSFPLRFNISQDVVNIKVLEEIKLFLLNILFFRLIILIIILVYLGVVILCSLILNFKK